MECSIIYETKQEWRESFASQQNEFVRNKTLESCWWCGSAWYKQFKIAKLSLCLSQQFQWLTVLSPRQFTDDNSKRLSLLQFAAPTAIICFCLDIHNSRNTTNSWLSYFSYCFQFHCVFIIVFIITEGLFHLKDTAAVACLSSEGHLSSFGIVLKILRYFLNLL